MFVVRVVARHWVEFLLQGSTSDPEWELSQQKVNCELCGGGEFQCILLVDLYQLAETAEALPNVTAARQYQYD